VASFARLGRIEVSHSSSERPVIDSNEIGNVDASGEGGGRIFIRGGEFVVDNAFIWADTRGSEEGQGIDIGITGQVTVRNGAEISATTESTGQGGNVTITATDITLREGGGISAESTGLDLKANPDAGRSGTIFITATDSFQLLNGGRVSVDTEQANAGDIRLNIGTLLHLSDHSSLTASVAGGAGNGGDITIGSVFVVLDEGSSIIANALEGQGGNILIRILGGGALFQSPDSRIEASSEFGVWLGSPDADITAGLTELPASFFDAATLLTTPCAERSGAEVSRLVIRRYEVLPDSPYALRVQLPQAILGATDRVADERDIPSMRVHPSLAFTCPDHG
jgi:hypothetical protein